MDFAQRKQKEKCHFAPKFHKSHSAEKLISGAVLLAYRDNESAAANDVLTEAEPLYISFYVPALKAESRRVQRKGYTYPKCLYIGFLESP